MNVSLSAVLITGALLAGPALAQAQIVAAPLAGGGGLTEAQKLERSAEHLDRMKGSLRVVLTRVEEARNEKDVVKLNCVNEKLTQIKGLLKVAEQADIALHEAISAHDAGMDAEFAKIAIAKGKIDALRGESEQCIGQLAYIVDERTTVEVQQPEGLPPDRDVTGHRPPPPPRVTPPIVRPPRASPY